MVKGKLAVVTGGANGIGWAAAKLLAAHGAVVWIFDREEPRDDIGARWIAVDVTSRPSIDAAFAAAGTPDIVIVNAGVAEEEPFLEHTAERWDRILSINLTGAFHTVQAAARLMKKRRNGSIV